MNSYFTVILYYIEYEHRLSLFIIPVFRYDGLFCYANNMRPKVRMSKSHMEQVPAVIFWDI